MRDPLLDDGPLALYHQTPERKNWDHPTLDEIARSLRKAHASNRTLEATVNELTDSKRKMKKELDDVRGELGQSRLRVTVLTSVLSSAATATFIGGLVALVRNFAH